MDYVKHIVLSPPGATFACASSTAPQGRTYENYDAVREDFLKGDISPDQLKRGLIDALNALLEPVRSHFANDATAKGLFEQVRIRAHEMHFGTPRRLELVAVIV